MNVGVVVARFQVDDLHDGHQLLLKAVDEENDIVIVVLGTCQPKNTMENPLDFKTRSFMVKEILPGAVVVPLEDHVDDEEWSKSLDQLIWSMQQGQWSVRLYGGRDSFLSYYSGKYITVPFGYVNHRSGTEVRETIGKAPRESADFRAGVIYASQNRYPTSFATVDVAVWRDDQLLLGRKAGMQEYCLIGGFVDPADPSYEEAGKREVAEEVGLFVQNFEYVCSLNVDDWRYRKGPDRIKTVLFNAEAFFPNQEAKAADDLAECRWFAADEFFDPSLLVKVQPCHRYLVAKALSRRLYG